MKTWKIVFNFLFAASLVLLTVLKPERAESYHNFFFTSADNIISGTLGNARLDPSSITKCGPSIEGNEIADNTIQGRNMGSGVVLSTHIGAGVLTAINQVNSTSSMIIGLTITTNGTNTDQVVVTAEAIDIMGCSFQLNSPAAVAFSTIPAFSTSVFLNRGIAGGAGGGSNLADPASTWHRIFAIAKTDCSTASVIVDSGNVTSPAMPTGYTKFRPLGYIYNDGSSNIVPIIKRGKKVMPWTARTYTSNSDAATTWTSINLANELSPKAYAVNLAYFFNNSAAVNVARCWLRFDGAMALTLAAGDDAFTEGDNLGATASIVRHANTTRYVPRNKTLVYYTDIATYCQGLNIMGLWYDEEE